MSRPSHIAYILDRFPVISQTFVSDEIFSVREAGVDCTVFALKEGNNSALHARARALLGAGIVQYASAPGLAGELASLLRLVVRHPFRAARASLKALLDRRFRWCARLSLPLAAAIEEQGATHIHAHFADTAARVAMWVHLWTGLPYTFTSHGYDIFDRPPPDLAELTRHAGAMVCVSRYNSAYLQREFALPPAKLRLIRCGIYYTDFEAPARHPEPDCRVPKLLCVARLEEIKGHAYLFEAVRKLLDDGYRPLLRLAGEGSHRESLEAHAARLGLAGHVEFLGAQTAAQVKALFAWCDLSVLPSMSESVGLVNMECLASGRLMIATRVLGVPELVQDRITGLLCPPGDPDALAAAVKWALRHPDEATAMVLRGQALVRSEFERTRCTAQLIALWSDCAMRRQGASQTAP